MAEKTIDIAKQLINAGEDFVVAKITGTTGTTPRKKGAWLLMTKDGHVSGTVGGGQLEMDTVNLCRKTLETKKLLDTYCLQVTGETQDLLDIRFDGTVDIQIQYVDAKNPGNIISEFEIKDTAYIFGAGHVGQALELYLRRVNFRTVVMDDRADFVNRDIFPDAAELIAVDDYQSFCNGLELDNNSYVIIMTRNHACNYNVLKEILRKPTAYIGMLGSKKNNAAILAKLRDECYTEEQLKRVHAPIGLQINAETPDEIGISIAAEIIRIRGNREGNDFS